MPIDLLHVDCMEFIKSQPANAFDLAITDPPYGIKRGETFGGTNWKIYDKKNWDDEAPGEEYFSELKRVSVNQIIWGANYFTKYLDPSMGWIFWDKGQDLTMGDGELAFSSFDRALRRVTINRCFIGEFGGLLHPTQKPVRLYKWLLHNYAKPGFKILDTHLGSASIAVACYHLGFNLTGCELDKDYYKTAVDRLETCKQQGLIFEPEQTYNPVQLTLL